MSNTDTSKNAITWPLVGGGAVSLVLVLVSVVYGLATNRMERLELSVQRTDELNRQHDTDIVKLQSTLDYVKLGQDDMKQSIQRLVTILEKKP